jgi:hypothetical protein
MNKKKAAGFIGLLASILLLLTGCPWQSSLLYGLQITGDGTGGAIAVYEASGNIYAQKLSPDGIRTWGNKGVLLGENGSLFSIFQGIHVISDGSGGAFISWPETISRTPPASIYHLDKLDSAGQKAWRKDIASVDQLVGDGSGGAIFDDRPDGINLSLIRIDSNGDFPWGENGVLLPQAGNTHRITGDGSGGVLVAWEELQYPPDARPGETISTTRIFVQRINGSGKPAWGDGVLLYTTPENTYAETPQIIDDGSGGAIVSWHQVPNQIIEDNSPEAFMMDILVQKVDATGKALWRAGGLPLEINRAAAGAFPIEPLPVSDGAGGVIIIWRDFRNPSGNKANLYAQRIDSSGNIMWQSGGKEVSVDAINPSHMIKSDGAGGAIVSYFYTEPRKDLHVQKLDATGEAVWPKDGLPVGGSDYSGYVIAPDGQGGLMVGWGVGKAMFSSEKAYIQRISGDGKLLWGEAGIRLDTK